jgi:hypothetical protein
MSTLPNELLLDQLCAEFPNVQREVLELCIETHQNLEQELGAEYDVEDALSKLCAGYASDELRGQDGSPRAAEQ